MALDLLLCKPPLSYFRVDPSISHSIIILFPSNLFLYMVGYNMDDANYFFLFVQ